MAFDFPASPTNGQIFQPSGGPAWQWNGSAWVAAGTVPGRTTAEPRNRIVNGAMQVNQEGAVSASGFYAADQWQGNFNIATVQGQRYAAVTPNGSQYVLNTSLTTAKGSLAASDLWDWIQTIEGIQMVDFQWGTANAKQVILRFWANANVAGTYGVSLRNGDATRSWTGSFTISTTGVWTPVTLVIPGDVTGTWPKDTSRGAYLGIAWAAGSTFTAAAAGWSAGNFLAPPGMSNMAATAGASVHVADVGLYLDPGNTGIAPPWQMPDEAQELAKCQRYWQVVRADLVGTAAAANNLFGAQYPFPVVMRTSPSVSPNADGTPTNVSTVSFDSVSFMNLRIYMQSTAAGTYGIAGRSCKVSARM